MTAMQFPPEVEAEVGRRLKRLEGQIRGVQRMLDEGADCRAIVTQLSACKAALDKVSYRLFAASMRHCADDPGSDIDADELERLFLKLS
jgi:DNA-binding FrmR family transcriptional regulator